MAEKYIKIRGKLVAVSEEVHYAYYHMGRQRRTQVEKERRRRVVPYDALDSDESFGIPQKTLNNRKKSLLPIQGIHKRPGGRR